MQETGKRHKRMGLKATFYRAGKLLVRPLFGCVARVRVVGGENTNCSGGFLLAANHISHFDPFLISLAVRRKIDWMAMAEFFRLPIVGLALRAVDTFPAERDRADRKTIRTAIERLKDGRIVGLFPEGGIRDGVRSLLEGAPLRPGASTLAHMAGVPVLPCVILGTDRFYSAKGWLPLRRTPVWIAFGKPVSHSPELEKFRARDRIESELADAFKSLYAELRQRFQLTADDLPHPPQERMKARRHSLRRAGAKTVDSLLCTSLNLLHTRHRLNGRSVEEMERYLVACEQFTPQEYYATPGDSDSSTELGASLAGQQHRSRRILSLHTGSDCTNGVPVAFANVHQAYWLSPLCTALQRTWLERLFTSLALSFFACSARLLERRAGNYLRSCPQCRRAASRCD